MFIDTHCHFNHQRFAEDMPACLERAVEAGVTRMVVVGFDMPSSEQAVLLAEANAPHLFAAVGVHPHDSKDWTLDSARRLADLADHPRVVAMGEIGLDFHYDFSPQEAQYTAFRAQLALAREAALPVIIHCREAYPETLEVLEEEEMESGGVMHCWAGAMEQAEKTVSLGLSLGFGGTLTFKNAEDIRLCAQSVPLETLLIETDAPYLAPSPHRGKRNESAYVAIVAEKLAALRGLTVEEIARLTTANAMRVFPRLVGDA